MFKTENCYKKCISKKFLMNAEITKNALGIVSKYKLKARTGRPGIEIERGLNGIYYLLQTGVHWKGLPQCFGSSPAVHRLFQKLRVIGFFEELWHQSLQNYDKEQKLKLETQATDCAHVKAPLGKEKTGKSPVDRRKLGTKRCIIVEGNGIVIGYSIAAGNQHDTKLFASALKTIPPCITQPAYKEMHLDAAYDSKYIRVALFNTYYVPKISPNKRRSQSSASPSISPKKRWIVESAHSWMNRFRALLVRFHKLVANYTALVLFSFAITNSRKLLL